MSTIEYVEEDPNKKSLNLDSIEQYEENKYKAIRRLLQPGDTASLATKACPFPHYNPLFTQRSQNINEEELNDESVTFDVQRRKVLKAKKEAPSREEAESLKSESGNEKVVDESISLYDPRYQDLGDNDVIPARHSRQQSGIAQDEENKSPDYNQEDECFIEERKSATEVLLGPGPYESITTKTPPEETTDRTQDNSPYRSEAELAALLSNMRLEVSRFDELSQSPRFESIITDLRRNDSEEESAKIDADLAQEELLKIESTPVVYQPETGSGRFCLSPEVKELVDQYNKSHNLPVSLIETVNTKKNARSQVDQLLLPVKSHLDRLPDKQTTVDPDIKRRIVQIQQMHKAEPDFEDLVVERPTIEENQSIRPDIIEQQNQSEEEDKIKLIIILIEQQLQQIVDHQNVTLRIQGIEFSPTACRRIASYALRICNAFTTEVVQLRSYADSCFSIRRDCERLEEEAVELGEMYLIYIKQRKVEWEIENEFGRFDDVSDGIDDEGFELQLKSELDDLRVVNVDKLWKKQLV